MILVDLKHNEYFCDLFCWSCPGLRSQPCLLGDGIATMIEMEARSHLSGQYVQCQGQGCWRGHLVIDLSKAKEAEIRSYGEILH